MEELKKELKKSTIAAIAAGVVAVGAVGAGLGITQPWKKTEESEPPEPPQEEVQAPQPGTPDGYLTVGGKQVPCTRYEGDGWSILVPQEWEASADPAGATLTPKGAVNQELSVVVGPGSQTGGLALVSCFQDAGGETMNRLFHTPAADRNYQVLCTAPEDQWEENKFLLAAIAKSFTLGGEQPFQSWSPLPEEPQWQVAEGASVLWLDKDGFVLDDPAKKAVDAAIKAWSGDERSRFTGKYRVDPFSWKASYTNLGGAVYLDVFEAKVWYQLADSAQSPAAASGGQEVVNGWYTGPDTLLRLAVSHNGEAVSSTQAVWTEQVPGLPGFAEELVQQ